MASARPTASARALAAFALAEHGVGNIAPVLFAGGGGADPGTAGRGIAAVTTMGYSGFLLGPPSLIGMAAEWTGLRLAMALTILAAVIIAVSAQHSPRQRMELDQSASTSELETCDPKNDEWRLEQRLFQARSPRQTHSNPNSSNLIRREEDGPMTILKNDPSPPR